MIPAVTQSDLGWQVVYFYNDYAAALDERRIADWPKFFAADGIYALTTYRNANGSGLYLIFEKGGEALKRRAAVASGYLQVQRTKTLHTVSNIKITATTSAQLDVRAYFAVFRTGRDGISTFHACGQFRDRLLLSADGSVRMAEHIVIFDAETLPSNMADLY